MTHDQLSRTAKRLRRARMMKRVEVRNRSRRRVHYADAFMRDFGLPF
jgi:hypothetical protein